METYDTLYKRSQTGAVLIWWCEREADRWRVCSGQKNGEITRSAWKTAKAKNIGKKNETTGEGQAHLDVESAYRKKLEQGRYHETESTIDVMKFFPPMLAVSSKDHPVVDEELDRDWVIQPKLNGIRNIATNSGLWTRKGKPIVALPHLEEALVPVFAKYPTLIIDGELYSHELREHLNRIASIVRKQTPTEEELEASRIVGYWMYDCFFDDQPDMGFTDRHYALREIMHECLDPSGWSPLPEDSTEVAEPHREASEWHLLRVLPYGYVESAEELAQQQIRWVERRGYEGLMLRRRDGAYESAKRSKHLRKVKTFIDKEFTILDILEGEGNRAGMAGKIAYRTDDGVDFKTGIKGTWEFARELLENKEKYIGGDGTVRFFEYTEYGAPFHGVTQIVYPGKRDM